MELKESVTILGGICKRLNSYLLKKEVEALQTAISHLETLQKVEEMGGVEKKQYSLIGNMHSGTNYDTAYNNGFNQAFDLLHAELAGKLEKLHLLQLPYPATFTKASPDGTVNEITLSFEAANKIQELILGKKEG